MKLLKKITRNSLRYTEYERQFKICILRFRYYV